MANLGPELMKHRLSFIVILAIFLLGLWLLRARTIRATANQASSHASTPLTTGTAPVGPILPAFFGLHINRLSTPWPQIPFGTLRLLGDLTTWVHLEGQGRNKYEWSTLDGWLKQAQQHGVELMYTFANTPEWAAADPHGQCGPQRDTPDCSPPKDLDTSAPCQGPLAGQTTSNCMFKEYVTSLLDHVCRGTAPHKSCQIKAFSCWNEPNLDGFWSGTYAQSARMCSDMVTIVKDQCADCLTLSPDISAAASGDTKENGESRDYNEWTRNFLIAYKKYGNLPDVGAFHPYAARTHGIVPVPFPDTFADSGCPGGGHNPPCPDTLVGKISALRSVFDQGGMAGKPLWATEGGWGTNGELLDPDAEAAYVARWLILQASAGVQRAYWYMWEYAGDPRGWGGLWSQEQGISKAGIAYGQVYNWLVGATFTKPCATERTVWTCDLSRPGGYQGRIVWDAAHSFDMGATSTYSAPTRFSQFQDLSGRKSVISGGTVTIGSKPILLETTEAAPVPK
jgi:hypothetical protein